LAIEVASCAARSASEPAKKPAGFAKPAGFIVTSSELPAITTVAATATTTTTAATTTTATTVAAIAAAAVATTTTTVATAAAAAITTAATAITAASTATESAAATTAALLALLGFVNAERSTVESAAIHTLDRLGGFLGGTHGHEREAARAARFAIGDEVDVADGSELLERGADAFCIGVEREIANVQTSVHRLLDLAQNKDSTRPRGGHQCSKAGFRMDF
jgi:hypothetical protein